ncbi:MAG: AAA family ATPase, partial [Halioglobus sp.]|nr:AAA family ATPase [Halioglobus sp.]
AYDWPGNVRELESRVKRAAIMADGSYIRAADLQLDGVRPGEVMPLNLRVAREDTDRKTVQRALALCDNNISTAANVLGIARPTMYKLLDKYGLKV